MIKPLSRRLVALFICAVTVVGCSSSPGPDTISSGSGQSQCTTCHAPGSAIDPLTTNSTGTFGKHVAHVTGMGFACETCHFNYTNLSTHANGTLDTTSPAVLVVYFDTSNPTGGWNNAAGTCSSLNCHGTDALDWYGTSAANYQSCTSCHSYALGARRIVTGTSGDFRANPAIVSNHVTTTGDPAPAQCKVCHDLSAHTSGTVLLLNSDGGASIVYNAAAPASLEPFCLSCHDTGGAASTFAAGGSSLKPFNDNNTLGSVPNVAGNKIQSYWAGTNNRHKTFGLTCAGTGAAITGCHGNSGKINMHGSVSKGLLTQNLTLGVVSAVSTTVPYDYDYKLCFDCHANFLAVSPQVVLGYKKGGNYDVTGVVPLTSYSTSTTTIQSLFRDQYVDSSPGVPFYNDSIPLLEPYAYLPLHSYHLLSVVTSTMFIPDANWMTWKYRGDASQAGRITCVTCHNVHGTNGLSARSTFDEFGIASAVSGPDQYSTMPLNNYNDATVMVSYPMNCAVDCHYMAGQTFYWNTPANE